MKHVNLNAQEESVKRFVLSLAIEPGSAVLEVDGCAVACIIPVKAQHRNGSMEEEWTDAKNDRRCDLIDRKIEGTLTPEEAVELHELQQEMFRYRHRVAPLPLEHARALLQELLESPKPVPGSDS
jgi:hypothetical protein